MMAVYAELLRALAARLRPERGQSLIEYVLVIFIVGVGLIAVLFFFQGAIADLFSDSGSGLDSLT